MRFHPILAALACAVLAMPLAAQTLKPGLWEMSNKNPQMDRMMADMQKQMAGMPAEQRKQMEEMMSRQGIKLAPGGAGGAVVQMCMTKDMVERNDINMGRSDCKVTHQERKGRTMKMAYTCTTPPSSGEGEFTFHSAEAYTSKMTVNTQMQGRTETTTIEGAGKWIAADCGAVKPITPPAK